MRDGPSVEHSRLAQLDAGRRVLLEGRHEDWLLVSLGAQRGWVRADMLSVERTLVDALPERTDFPAPPPRWVWPARGTITSRFGPRWGSFHNGLDIANRAWTPIVAARSGIVKEAGWCSGYGYCVKLRHDGGVETIYGHLIDEPVVERGDEVLVGELIGHMGSTYDRAGGGYSTGVHLHLTVLVNGKAVNPLLYLP
jgi:murein DD-endopeptidase MepM/ murein hydrolase activator NlpD